MINWVYFWLGNMTPTEVENVVVNPSWDKFIGCGYYQAIFTNLNTNQNNMLTSSPSIDMSGLTTDANGISLMSGDTVRVDDVNIFETYTLSVAAYF